MTLSLLRQKHPLASAHRQRAILEGGDQFSRFEHVLDAAGLGPLEANGIEVLQINVGKKCNQTCRHCHVDAGPDRREVMTRETMQHCLGAVAAANIPTVDITGGAPELNPDFRWLVAESRKLGARVIDRCNLTILLAPGYEDLPTFLASHAVEVIASLPCYSAENTNSQRGEGVFERSIKALQTLNDAGYARPGSGLVLNLVYNPLGPHLPPEEGVLEAAYRRELGSRYGIEFNRLFTITNMPISRFLEDLVSNCTYEHYMSLLVNAFNPAAVSGLMCRSMLSVGWDGGLFDCDFNQMLDLAVDSGPPRHIRDFNGSLNKRRIVVGQHCFGCTAGSGSSCQGAIVTSGPAIQTESK